MGKRCPEAHSTGCRGSMRDGLSILDLCITYGDGKVLEKDAREILGETSGEVMARLFKAISREDLKGVIDVVREISERGKDMGEPMSGDWSVRQGSSFPGFRRGSVRAWKDA